MILSKGKEATFSHKGNQQSSSTGASLSLEQNPQLKILRSISTSTKTISNLLDLINSLNSSLESNVVLQIINNNIIEAPLSESNNSITTELNESHKELTIFVKRLKERTKHVNSKFSNDLGGIISNKDSYLAEQSENLKNIYTLEKEIEEHGRKLTEETTSLNAIPMRDARGKAILTNGPLRKPINERIDKINKLQKEAHEKKIDTEKKIRILEDKLTKIKEFENTINLELEKHNQLMGEAKMLEEKYDLCKSQKADVDTFIEVKKKESTELKYIKVELEKINVFLANVNSDFENFSTLGASEEGLPYTKASKTVAGLKQNKELILTAIAENNIEEINKAIKKQIVLQSNYDKKLYTNLDIKNACDEQKKRIKDIEIWLKDLDKVIGHIDKKNDAGYADKLIMYKNEKDKILININNIYKNFDKNPDTNAVNLLPQLSAIDALEYNVKQLLLNKEILALRKQSFVDKLAIGKVKNLEYKNALKDMLNFISDERILDPMNVYKEIDDPIDAADVGKIKSRIMELQYLKKELNSNPTAFAQVGRMLRNDLDRQLEKRGLANQAKAVMAKSGSKDGFEADGIIWYSDERVDAIQHKTTIELNPLDSGQFSAQLRAAINQLGGLTAEGGTYNSFHGRYPETPPPGLGRSLVANLRFENVNTPATLNDYEDEMNRVINENMPESRAFRYSFVSIITLNFKGGVTKKFSCRKNVGGTGAEVVAC